MDLKELLGEELYGQVETKIQGHNETVEDKSKHVKLVDLSEGGYVGQEKYQSAVTEAKGYKEQLGSANTAIQSYKDMDIDGIKQSVQNWETKYNEDTQKLKMDMEVQQKTFAAEKYLDGQRIKSPFAKKAILNEFLSRGFEFKDGSFAGADDYMKKLREQSPDDFVKDETEKKPTWVRGTQNSYKPKNASEEEAYLENKYGKNKYARK